jgi:hypothetical protein
VTIIAAVAAIWVLGLLSLLFTLPHECLLPTKADDNATRELTEP